MTHDVEAGPIIENPNAQNGLYKYSYNTTSIENGELVVTNHYKFSKEVATGFQDFGDVCAITGYALTLSVVGAEVGVPLAEAGTGFSTFGDFLELGVDILNMDWANGESGKLQVAKKVGFMLLKAYVPSLLNKVLPGARHKIGSSDFNLGDEILMQGAKLKLSGIERGTNAVIDHTQSTDSVNADSTNHPTPATNEE